MKHTGWRKPTPGLGVAQQHAQAGEQIDVPKTRAFVAVKRVGAKIGLKAADMMLLDTLATFTQPQDWEEGQRPIVWASNAYLMERTGFSLSALKRHARRLAEIGVISFQDSPNGKRWGRRDAEGRIVEAYGFDLSPLSARVAEFEELHANLQADRILCQRLKRQITVARRMIRATINAAVSSALRGPWSQLLMRLQDILERLPHCKAVPAHLAQHLAWLKTLQDRVEAAYRSANDLARPVENTMQCTKNIAAKTDELDPKGAIFGPHILATNDPIPVDSNRMGDGQAEIEQIRPDRTDRDETKKKACRSTQRIQQTDLDPGTVMQACPEFTTWAHHVGGYLNDWGDLHRVAGQLRPMIGMSEQAWNTAQVRLGQQVATAALALIFEKHCAAEISSPDGYMRGMLEKAGAGELHLERSFYGRLRRQAA